MAILRNILNSVPFKAGVHVNAVLTSLNFSANISRTFQPTLNLYAYNHNHCLAVLCKFLGAGFLGILGKRDFFSKDRLN